MKNEEQIQYLSLDAIDPDPGQPRTGFDPEDDHALAESLKEVGQLVPIRVRMVDGRYPIVDGGRRYRAAKLAGLTTIAAIIEGKDLSRGEITQRQLIANCQREDLKPLETANAIQGLMQQTGWNASTAAKRLSFSNAKVSRLLALLQLPESIKERVQRGEIPLTAATQLGTVEDKETQEAFATLVASGDLTRDRLAGAIRSQNKQEGSSQSGISRVSCKLPSGSSVTVAADSLDMEDFITALEEVLAKARKARTQGIEVSTLAKMFRDQARA